LGVFFVHFLIRQAFVAVSQKDDAAVLESVFQDVVLHDMIVAVCVDADVALPLKTKLHDTLENTMHLREAGNAVDDMISLCVVQPLTLVNLRVSRLGRRQKSEIGHNLSVVLYHKTAIFFHVRLHDLQRRIAVDPLVQVARLNHYGFACSKNLHNALCICRQ